MTEEQASDKNMELFFGKVVYTSIIGYINNKGIIVS